MPSWSRICQRLFSPVPEERLLLRPSLVSLQRAEHTSEKIGEAALAILPTKAPNPLPFFQVYLKNFRGLCNQLFSGSVPKKINWKVFSDERYFFILLKSRDKWLYPNEKKGISSPLCDLRSIDIEWIECLSTLRNSGLWQDSHISPCVVSKWGLSIGRLFNTGAFTSPVLSIKSVWTHIAWNRSLSWTNGGFERLSSVSRDSFEGMKPKMCFQSPISKSIFKPGNALIKIRWYQRTNGINWKYMEFGFHFVEVAEMQTNEEYLCEHWRDNSFHRLVAARRKFVLSWIYNFSYFSDINSEISFR